MIVVVEPEPYVLESEPLQLGARLVLSDGRRRLRRATLAGFAARSARLRIEGVGIRSVPIFDGKQRIAGVVRHRGAVRWFVDARDVKRLQLAWQQQVARCGKAPPIAATSKQAS